MALILPILGAVITAAGSLAAAALSRPSDPPAPVVPAPPPPPPTPEDEGAIAPEGVIDEQLNRSREIARQTAEQSEQFLQLSKEPASLDDLTKITAGGE